MGKKEHDIKELAEAAAAANPVRGNSMGQMLAANIALADRRRLEKGILSDAHVIPSPEAFVPYIRQAADAVVERLIHAGRAYGESVLFELGETGAVALSYTKASRALWSFKQGKPPSDRTDTWLDLCGYALLEMARQAYESGEEQDGLFDRRGDDI